MLLIVYPKFIWGIQIPIFFHANKYPCLSLLPNNTHIEFWFIMALWLWLAKLQTPGQQLARLRFYTLIKYISTKLQIYEVWQKKIVQFERIVLQDICLNPSSMRSWYDRQRRRQSSWMQQVKDPSFLKSTRDKYRQWWRWRCRWDQWR